MLFLILRVCPACHHSLSIKNVCQLMTSSFSLEIDLGTRVQSISTFLHSWSHFFATLCSLYITAFGLGYAVCWGVLFRGQGTVPWWLHHLPMLGWTHIRRTLCLCCTGEHWTRGSKVDSQSSSITHSATCYECRWPSCPSSTEWELLGGPQACDVTSPSGASCIPGVGILLQRDVFYQMVPPVSKYIWMNTPSKVKLEVTFSITYVGDPGGLGKLLTLSSLDSLPLPRELHQPLPPAASQMCELCRDPGFLFFWSTYSLYLYPYIFTLWTLQNLFLILNMYHNWMVGECVKNTQSDLRKSVSLNRRTRWRGRGGCGVHLSADTSGIPPGHRSM